MSTQKYAVLVTLAGALAVHAAETLTGRIVNASSAALANAKVWLKNRPEIFDSTGTDGKFSLTLAPSAIPSLPGRDDGNAAFRLQANRLSFFLNGTQDVAVELFGVHGGKIATLYRGSKGRGDHSIFLAPERFSVPAGHYLLTFDSREARGSAQVVISESKAITYSPVSTSLPAAGSQPYGTLAKASAAAETLIVLRMGHEIKKSALAGTASQDFGDISLKVRSYRRDTAVAIKAGGRRIEVYVPSDYKELYHLPVLYLLHGGGANETYWRADCKFLDSLNTYSDRVNVQPMIIVTPSAGGNTNYGAYGKTADPFYADLTTDIRAYTESHYKVDTARFSRAISGLSMGAMQTWNLTLFYPKLWGYSLPMSGGLYKSGGFTTAKMRSDAASKVIDVAAINEMKLFRVFVNPTDIAFGDTDTTTQLAESLDIRLSKDLTTRTSGGHTDPYWNEVFRKYAPLLFKQ